MREPLLFDSPDDLQPGFKSNLGPGLPIFWYELEEVFAAVKPFTPDDMAEFLHDSRAGWKAIEEDIARNAALGEMLERVLTIRDRI
jgi:hypothetical protein